MTIRIASAGYEAEIRPDLGGALTALRRSGRDILRPVTGDPVSPIDTACFPLVPFANRIAHGRFDWQGRRYAHPVLPQFDPHALHGQGWREPWQVEAVGASQATLSLNASNASWPQPWLARQHVSLTEAGLQVVLSVTNQGEADMPAGLGLHPYFPCRDAEKLRFGCDRVWLVGPDEIPTAAVDPAIVADFDSGQPLAGGSLIDHCYAGWTGVAAIHYPDGVTRVEASPPADHLHVYRPPGQGYVCLEPVTHRPDALNGSPGEMPVLEPGATTEMTMLIRFDP